MTKGKTVMIQGTGSHVGKSTLVAALCRIFVQDGMSVAPFKAQNMSNNAFVCRDGGEIGRATAVQAAAARIEPTTDMNPVLLKPRSDVGCQVIVKGKVVSNGSASDYELFKPSLVGTIKESLDRLRSAYDIVVIEGAGSCAEVNLRDRDIVNMKTAELADAPVILVGNIDWGGIFAQLIGTMDLLLPEEKARVKGLVINMFRGDLSILRPGLSFIEERTGRPLLGVLPYFKNIRIAEEDSLTRGRHDAPHADRDKIHIDVIVHPRIANFTDFDAFGSEPDVSVRYIDRPDEHIPDVLMIPGTKSTIADLRHLISLKFDRTIQRCVENGATVVGICGGLQMLGERILDPECVESDIKEEAGLGFLPLTTIFSGTKETAQVRGYHLASGAEISGYEIHMGRTEKEGDSLFQITERSGSAVQTRDGMAAGRVWGTYIHGIFDSPIFRRWFINEHRTRRGMDPLAGISSADPSAEMDKLAEMVRTHIDMARIYDIIK